MKSSINYKILLKVIIIASIFALSPLLMAFAPYSLGQLPAATPSWILKLLEKIGKWVLENLPLVVQLGGQLVNSAFSLFNQCGPGTIIPDLNNSLNGTYNGCIKIEQNGNVCRLYHAFMTRPSINAPWDLAPSFRNICK